MDPLTLLSQEKHDHYLSRATSEAVCIAVCLCIFFFVGFLPFLLQKRNVFYTVFQANEIRTVMFLRFLFSVVEKLDFYTHKALFINLV